VHHHHVGDTPDRLLADWENREVTNEVAVPLLRVSREGHQGVTIHRSPAFVGSEIGRVPRRGTRPGIRGDASAKSANRSSAEPRYVMWGSIVMSTPITTNATTTPRAAAPTAPSRERATCRGERRLSNA